jgi:hypothetical protein
LATFASASMYKTYDFVDAQLQPCLSFARDGLKILSAYICVHQRLIVVLKGIT